MFCAERSDLILLIGASDVETQVDAIGFWTVLAESYIDKNGYRVGVSEPCAERIAAFFRLADVSSLVEKSIRRALSRLLVSALAFKDQVGTTRHIASA